MAEIKIDTQKINECGNDLIKLVDDLKELYGDLFDRLAKVPNETKEIVGPGASEYFTKVAKDKTIFMDYANNLYKYGEFLVNTASEYEDTIKGVEEDL